jgi:hypothetical protein
MLTWKLHKYWSKNVAIYSKDLVVIPTNSCVDGGCVLICNTRSFFWNGYWCDVVFVCMCARVCNEIPDCALLGVTSLALQRKAFIAEVKLRPVWCVESKKNILVICCLCILILRLVGLWIFRDTLHYVFFLCYIY